MEEVILYLELPTQERKILSYQILIIARIVDSRLDQGGKACMGVPCVGGSIDITL